MLLKKNAAWVSTPLSGVTENQQSLAKNPLKTSAYTDLKFDSVSGHQQNQRVTALGCNPFLFYCSTFWRRVLTCPRIFLRLIRLAIAAAPGLLFLRGRRLTRADWKSGCGSCRVCGRFCSWLRDCWALITISPSLVMR